jgi:hypothetical protein
MVVHALVRERAGRAARQAAGVDAAGGRGPGVTRGGEPSHRLRPPAGVVVPIVLAVACCVAVFHQVRPLVPRSPHNVYTFAAGSDCPRIPGYELLAPWRSRLLAFRAAGALHGLVSRYAGDPCDVPVLEITVALWTAAWLLATQLLFITCFRERSLLYVLGTFASVSFGYQPGLVSRIYPWDMPALFFFSVFVVLLRAGRIRWMILLLPFAVGFKETVVVLPLAHLFNGSTVRRRVLWTATAAATCVCAKLAYDLASSAGAVLLTASGRFETGGLAGVPVVLVNLRLLLSWRGLPAWLANAGTLVPFLALPVRQQDLVMLKLLGLAFTAAMLCFGVVTELRIWFEMIPLALYTFDRRLLGAEAPPPSW